MDQDKLPPTRPVAGGHLGMNLHLSEIVSELVEPMVVRYEGGREVISTEDLIARVVRLNESNTGWSKWSWWEGQRWENYVSCGKCVGEWGKPVSRDDPELCWCEETQTLEGSVRVTIWWLKRMRRIDWETRMGWDIKDSRRTIQSCEVNPEDLQDYQTPMVVMGSDVVALYPSMDTRGVGDIVREAVKKSDIDWRGVDYMEAVRYIALNWTEEQCKGSRLRKVLPWRRKKGGTRPGIRGAGPKGPERGDTDQWIFPRVVLSYEDKLEIIGTVLSIATSAMFQHHYYSFGGETYRQEEGGPIGLRGTCAIARLWMQAFDVDWEGDLDKMGVVTNLIMRYMDDGRSIMPPLKPGWRWVEGGLKFCLDWEREDQELSDQEITRRGLLGSLNQVDQSLKFTMEVGEDFDDLWLPTLDTKMLVDGSNKVQFGFYEKPTSSNMTVQRRSAMGEDAKVQIVSNDLVRRLMNNAEELGKESKIRIVDDYSQKLANSGYKGEQLRKIIANGIKGYEGKRRRALLEGRRLHRTAVDSQGSRLIKKLLAKTTWFRGRKKKEVGEHDRNSNSWGGGRRTKTGKELKMKSVLFVEQSPGGELAAKMREVLKSMEHTMGFKIKVAERAGNPLKSIFPLTSLWEGAQCGRTECVTCLQDVEEMAPCTRKNLVYENICVQCNPGATKGGSLETLKEGAPSIYIGETSRTIFERSREHWDGVRKGEEGNHMVKHQRMEHIGELHPKFAMKVVKFHKTALARQVAEAVRIRRRGGEGAILNSRGEFNRCHIPRLKLEEREQNEVTNNKDREQNKKMLREQDRCWEKDRILELGAGAVLGPSTSPVKRRGEDREQQEVTMGGAVKKRRKEWKYEVLEEGWGELEGADTTTAPEEGGGPVSEPQSAQELVENSIGEQSPVQWSRIPREQSLVQLRVTGFYNPAPTLKDNPTIQNVASRGRDDDQPLLGGGCGGSPCGLRSKEDLSTGVGVTTFGDEQSSGGGDIGCDSIVDNQVWRGENERGDLNVESEVVTGCENECIALPSSDICGELSKRRDEAALNETENVRLSTPSVGQTETVDMDVLTEQSSIDNNHDLYDEITPSVGNTDDNTMINKNECEFRRGGMCIQHGIVGTKYTVTKSKWSELKNGLFGYKKSKVTKYRCNMRGLSNKEDGGGNRGVTKSVTRGITRGNTEALEENLALGMGVDNFPGSDIRISEVGIRRAGANRERKFQNELNGRGLE